MEGKGGEGRGKSTLSPFFNLVRGGSKFVAFVSLIFSNQIVSRGGLSTHASKQEKKKRQI